MKRHLLLAGAVVACCAGVAWSATAIPDDPIEYSGCIRWGFEEAFFVPLPNTSYEKWWITAVPDDFAEMMTGIPGDGHSRVMFARVYATVGPEGRYGHLGMGSREIAIGAIVELRQFEAADGSCAMWTPPPPVPPPEANTRRVPTRNDKASMLA
ncbi:hypothetical protein JM946_06480 [Steroidobacter sp. S1-65]|uniref:Lipoprotein n=1 Tax=Steroidobacter gossypii TaxID=2805490 RepID=A0ABS1WTT2_9GAMM|nr:hypothetical protein [Steroidobacter gossypii]MBM0104383.1 hypothetical protein [Steroidobacter gossypii]